MNTGQMFLTIAAIFLLGTVILTVNRGLLSSNSIMIDNRYGIICVSLATSMMERATDKAFDEKSDTLGLTMVNNLTLRQNLGLDAGESINDPDSFDDFDDYDCYRLTPRADSLELEGTDQKIAFLTYCQVDYVNESVSGNPGNPSIISMNRTWHKRMIVKVFSPGMQDTIKLSTVYSYWYFR